MSHHGMHIPPQLPPLMPGMGPLEKLKEAKKKERLKQTASTGGFGEVDELKDEDELEDATGRKRRGRGNPGGQPEQRAGGKPMQQQMSDKTVKNLLRVQEGVTINEEN